jgi:gas vesicle protein GvpL/GvpF
VSAEGWYLYGVVEAREAPDLQPGIELLAEGRLAGVTSRVSLEEFDEEALPQRLADPAWLEENIRRHEQVLESVLATTAVLPCRFCTVYRNEADLRRFLSERQDELVAALAQVEGRVELGVKAFVDPERFAEDATQENDRIRKLAAHAAEAEGGRGYLESRRLEREVGNERARFGQEAAAQLHQRLLGTAESGVLLDLQRPELSGRNDEMVLNGAYLVSDRPGFERELAALAAELSKRGIELELTGPWPPYNFVAEELRA